MRTASLTLIDCNNFYSPSGGGVRRYHLQKLEYFRKRPQFKYVHVRPGDVRRTEQVGENAFIEYIPAFKVPGEWDYRYSIRSRHLKKIIREYQPDVIEVGSPYFMPILVRHSLRGLAKQPKVVGFWHSDFPITYMKRGLLPWGNWAANASEKVGWKFARWNFRAMDEIFVPSLLVQERLSEKNIGPTRYMPLGVNTELFNPVQKDLDLIEKLKAGVPERLTIFFPHRFCDEKGLKLILEAYPLLCEELKVEPALVFAGTGPDLSLVEAAAREYPHIRFLGFVENDREMARWNASCEMGLALSGWETFGLSILEAMASGQMLVGASTGAALEHIRESGCGLTIDHQNKLELVEAIVKLARHSDRKKLSEKARDYASDRTWRACFDREVAAYFELCKKSEFENAEDLLLTKPSRG